MCLHSLPSPVFLGFPGGQSIKNPSAMQKTWLRSLSREDPLEKEMATRSSILAWRIPMDRGAWWATVCGVTKSRTQLSDSAQHSTCSSCLFIILIPNADTQWPCCVGPPKTGGSWWRDQTECGPLEKGMANHFSMLALRTP